MITGLKPKPARLKSRTSFFEMLEKETPASLLFCHVFVVCVMLSGVAGRCRVVTKSSRYRLCGALAILVPAFSSAGFCLPLSLAHLICGWDLTAALSGRMKLFKAQQTRHTMYVCMYVCLLGFRVYL